MEEVPTATTVPRRLASPRHLRRGKKPINLYKAHFRRMGRAAQSAWRANERGKHITFTANGTPVSFYRPNTPRHIQTRKIKKQTRRVIKREGKSVTLPKRICFRIKRQTV